MLNYIALAGCVSAFAAFVGTLLWANLRKPTVIEMAMLDDDPRA